MYPPSHFNFFINYFHISMTFQVVSFHILIGRLILISSLLFRRNISCFIEFQVFGSFDFWIHFFIFLGLATKTVHFALKLFFFRNHGYKLRRRVQPFHPGPVQFRQRLRRPSLPSGPPSGPSSTRGPRSATTAASTTSFSGYRRVHNLHFPVPRSLGAREIADSVAYYG